MVSLPLAGWTVSCKTFSGKKTTIFTLSILLLAAIIVSGALAPLAYASHNPDNIATIQLTPQTISDSTHVTGSVLMDDPRIKYVDNNNNGIRTGAPPPADAVVHDANLDGEYSGIGAAFVAPGAVAETVIVVSGAIAAAIQKDDPKIKYVDANANTIRNVGESTVYDTDADGIYDAGEPVIAGPTPVLGALLVDDSRVRYIDFNNNNVWEAVAAGQEPVFFSTDADLIFDCALLTGCEPVLNPKDDPRLKFVDQNSSGTWNSPEDVVFDANSNNRCSPGEVIANAPCVATSTVFDWMGVEIRDVQDLSSWQVTIEYNPAVLFVQTMILPQDDTINFIDSYFDQCNDADFSGFCDPAEARTYTTIVSIDNSIGRATLAYSFLGASTPGPLTCDTVGGTTLCPVEMVRPRLEVMSNPAFSGVHFLTDTEDPVAGTGIASSTSHTTAAMLYNTEDGFYNNNANVVTLEPDANYVFSPANPVPTTGPTVSFDATASVNAASYSWDFGDGATGTGVMTSHTYASLVKNYRSVLRVEGSTPGTFSSASQWILVRQVAVAFDYSLAIDVAADKVPIGGSTSATVTATLTSGTPSAITFTSAGAPADVAVVFATPSCTPTCSTLVTFTAGPSAPTGTFPITISATPSGSTPADESVTFTLTIVNPLTADFTVPASVTAGKPAMFNAIVSGGTPPYLIQWDVGKDGIVDGTGQTFTHTFPAKGAVSIDLKVTDANGDVAIRNKNIVIAPQPLIINAVCQNGTAGKPITCDASAQGGTAPYTFTWDVGKDGIIDGTGAQFTRTFPTKGTFSIDAIVRDANGATAQRNIMVNIAPQPLAIQANCSPGTAGKPVTCDASASGGTGPYTFTWDVGKDGIIDGTGVPFTTSFPTKGTFSIDAIVRDANGATARQNIMVNVAPQPLAVTASCGSATAGKPVSCQASASGGTAPYTFQWDVGKDGLIDGTGPSFSTSFPSKGTFSIDAIVRDANGATAKQNIMVVVAGQPLIITASCSSGTAGKPVNCTASASGGTGPYTFQWDVGKDGLIDGTGPSFSTSFPSKGTFSIDAIARDANGATARQNIMVVVAGQPIVVTASCGPATAGKPVTCSASASGGTGPYTFTWDVGKDGLIDGTGPSFSTSFPSKGTFSIDAIARDANGATAKQNIMVQVAAQPLVITAACSDGTVGKPVNCTASAQGGTGPYTFTWDVGKDGIIDGTGPTFSTSFAAKGTFSIDAIVRDANGATTKQNIMVRITGQPLVITAQCPNGTVGKPINCTASASGGTGPYTFTWDVGKDGTIDGTGATFSHSFAAKGTFSIDAIVRDANGVTAKQNIMVVVAGQPLVITASCGSATAGKPVTCSASASGGTAPYTFTWDVRKDGTIDGTGASFTTSFPTKGTVSIDAIVRDANGATARQNIMVVVAAQPLTADFTFTQPVVAGQPVTFTGSATGGTPPYTFRWDVGKDGIIDGTGQTFTHTFPSKGTFSVDLIVTDGNNAQARVNKVVGVSGTPPTGDFTFTTPVTAGKPVTFDVTSVSGGTPPYQFRWDIGKDGIIDGSGDPFTTSFPTKGVVSVDLIITDANMATTKINKAVNVAPQPLAINASCSGGAAGATAGKPVTCDASASGGTGPYAFTWDVGKDGLIDGTGVPFTTSFATKGTFSIDAIVRDANGATAKQNIMVVVAGQPLVIQASCSSATAGKPVNCSASASGGTGPYTFTWDVGKDGIIDGTGSSFTTSFAAKGTFSIDALVRDANGATAKQNIMVVVAGQPLMITASCSTGTAGKPVNCNASASGGTGPYTFQWDVGKDGVIDGTGPSFSTSFPSKGSFSIDAIARDANGATAKQNIMVVVAGQPLVIQASCSGGAAGATAGKPVTCNASASGGTAPYTFTWDVGKDGTIDGSGATFTTSFPAKGTFSIDAIARDANGATARQNIMVVVAGQPLTITASCGSATAGKPVTCDASASGGTGPYTFTWDVGKDGTIDGTGPSFSTSFPSKGTFSIDANVRDANGATAKQNIMVTVTAQPLVITAQCSSGAPGQPINCSASASGGTAPYTFTWDVGKDGTIDGTGPTFTTTFASKGQFSIDALVRDANGATAKQNIIVSVSGQPLVITASCSSGTAGKPVNCSASASGGTAPYTFTWDVGKDGSIDGSGSTFSHSFATKGTFSIDALVRDANGATARQNIMVVVAGQPLTIGASCGQATAGKPVSCQASASGGTAPYTFTWDVGKDGTIDGTGPSFQTSFATKGTFSIDATVRDANGATAKQNVMVVVAPQPLTADFTFTQPVVAGQPTTFTGSANGGTAPYRFQWDVGKDGTIDAEGQTVQFTFAAKGSVSVDLIVTDANQDVARVNKLVGVSSTPPTGDFGFDPVAPTAGKPVTFFVTSVSGGTPPYSFIWDVGKDGTIDAQGDSFTTTFPRKGPVSVDLHIRDANNALARINKMLDVAPQQLVIGAQCGSGTAGKPITCSASASGGTAPYTFTWDVGKDGTIDAQGPTVDLIFPSKGTFSVDAIVRDANGATARANMMASVSPQPLAIQAGCSSGTAGKPVTCDASASGGTGPYTFTWDVGKDGTTDGAGPSFSTSFATKGTFSIDAIVRDANGATARKNIMVSIAPQPLTITSSCTNGTIGQPISCSASASGGTGPYTFQWDVGKDGTIDGTGPSFTTSFAAKGTFSIDAIARDANGATAKQNNMVRISGDPLVLAAQCSNGTAGKPIDCSSSATGGTAPYTFTWDVGKDGTIDGQGQTFRPVFASKGTFSVDAIVRDANGDVARKNIMVQIAGQPLTISAQCSNGTAGKPISCSASASGGTSPYVFTWDKGKDGTVDATGAQVQLVFPVKGTFSVDAIVRDANGATARVNLTVSISAQPLVVDFTFSPSNPTVGQTVTFTATGSGGTTPYSFSWSFGDGATGTGNPVTHSYSAAGTFSVTVTLTDGNAATATRTRTITVGAFDVCPRPKDLVLEDPSAPGIPVANYSCRASPPWQVLGVGVPITFDPCVSDGQAPDGCRASYDLDGTIVRYEWNFGDGSPVVVTTSPVEQTHTYSVDGMYTVTLTVTDNDGNQDTKSRTLDIQPAPINRFLKFDRKLRSGTSLTQVFEVRIENPNAFQIYINVEITGTGDTVSSFALETGPVLMNAGETKVLTLSHTFSMLDVGTTWIFQMRLSFGFDTNTAGYRTAAIRTGSFRIV